MADNVTNQDITSSYQAGASAQQTGEEALRQLLSNINQGQYTGSALQQTDLAAQKVAENRLAQQQATSQLSAMDAIRKANASAIASGANQGLAAAQQLQAILGMQGQAVEGATDVANQFIQRASEGQKSLTEAQTRAGEIAGQLATSQANLISGAGQFLTAQTGARESQLTDVRTQQQLYQGRIDALEAAGQGNSSEALALRELLQTLQSTATGGTAEEIAAAQATGQEAIRQGQVDVAAASGLDKINTLNTKGDAYTQITSWYNPITGQTETLREHPSGISDQKETNARRAEDRTKAQEFINWANEPGLDAAEKTRRQNELIKWSNSIQSAQSGCVTGDTLITMADGIQKRIKDIKAGESVLSYNPATGNIVTTLYIPCKHSASRRFVLCLTFSNGKTVDTVDGHSFCLSYPRKAVAINFNNVNKYLGREFLIGPNQYAILKKYTSWETFEPVYSPMASKTMWLYTNDVLSTAHFTEFIVNARLQNPNPTETITFEQVPKKIQNNITKELFEAYDGEMLSYWAKGFRKFTISKKIKKLIKLI